MSSENPINQSGVKKRFVCVKLQEQFYVAPTLSSLTSFSAESSPPGGGGPTESFFTRWK